MVNFIRRRKYLIDKKMQLRYLGMILLAIIIINIIVGFGIYFSVWSTLKTEYSDIIVAQKIVTAQRIKAYEDARLGVSTMNSSQIDKESALLSEHLINQLKESFAKTRTKMIPLILLILIIIFLE
ncbi:hypothetical protein ACFLQ8_03040, partial [Candidatus Auribacterota bacterium]